MADWRSQEVPWPADIAATVRAFAGGDECAWLDSAVTGEIHAPLARYGLMSATPVAVIEQFDGGPARLVVGGRRVAEDANGWRLWRQACKRLPQLPRLPFGLSPGWVGYVGFEMARQLERLPSSHEEDLGLPLLRLAFYDRAIVLDHREHLATALAATGVRAALEHREEQDDGCEFERWVRRWEHAATARLAWPRLPVPEIRPELRRTQFEHMVHRALEYIAAGDIYQVNLAQRLRLTGVGDALATYAALRLANPAPYAAFLRWDGGALASLSPELFLRVRGRAVLTSPIKGTRPRTWDPMLDTLHRNELLASEKDAAELAMIIDLHRNDLGRVCEYGSVQVVEPRRVESHPSVFHTVADVAGRLAPGRDALDLLVACFPAGSVTGAPKIRAIEIIDELEPVARGAYTGTVGVLGLDGQATFNVGIRTLQIRGDQATLYVGGGIVADSDPADEYEETWAKAAGILGGLRMKNGECGMLNDAVPSCSRPPSRTS